MVVQVEEVPLKDLIPYARNSRTHSESQVSQIAGSIQEFGWTNPVLIDSGGVIIAGHGRVLAAERLKRETAPCIRLTHLTDAQKRAYVIADNRLALNAGWDEAMLANELSDLRADEFDLGLLGFDADELAKLLNFELGDETPAEVVEDEVPEPPVDPITKPGDLWILGSHRLLCGDSTKAADVARLMGGHRADACITDPPYSVNYDKSQEQRGGNAVVHGAYHEADINPTEILSFMEHVPCDVMLWSYPVDRHFQSLAAAYKKHGWEFRKELIWVKDSFSFWMSAKYQQKHEPIMWAVRKGKPLGGVVAANKTTVFEFPRPRSHELHPTAKPIGLWAELVSNHVERDGIVYEPFSGSGTSIIASEQTSRRCFAIELEPQYVDVAVKRWENLTGRTACLEQSATPA